MSDTSDIIASLEGKSVEELQKMLMEVTLIRARDAELALDVEKCMEDYWEFCRYVQTEWEEAPGQTVIRPYPIGWAFLRKYHDGYVDHDMTVVEKSRGMLASTDPLVWSLWQSLRAVRSHSVWKTAIIRQSESDGQMLLARTFEIYNRLPAPLRFPLSKKNESELKVDGGGYMRVLHAKGEAGRGEGWDLVLLDEFAYQDYAEKNWRAFQRARRKLAVSTPNGEGNLFCGLAHGIYPGVHKVRLHYSEHPDRKPGTEVGDAWIAKKKSEMSAADWDREYEIKYDSYAEPGWFTQDFVEQVIEPVEWDGKSTVIIGVDPGFVRSGAMVSYVNQYSQWCRMKEFLGVEELTDAFCRRVFEWVRDTCPGAPIRLSADPAAAQRKSILSPDKENTDLEVIERVAREVFQVPCFVQNDKIRKVQRKDGHRLIRQQFKLRADNRFGTIVDPTGCPMWIAGCKGAYRQLENATPQQLQNEEPNRTTDHVHIFDADRYPVVQFIAHMGIPEYTTRPKWKSSGGKPVLSATQKDMMG